jgi:hypothetical protein
VYPQAITTTDARIGQVLRALRRRPTYGFESWTVIVTTDHGQRNLDEPSLVSHLSQTPLEITSFLIGAGPGLGNPKSPKVVDIAPTVLQRLGIPVRKSWKLDGKPLARPKRSHVSASVRKGRLRVSLRLAAPKRGARRVTLHLPGGTRASAATLDAFVNGKPVGGRVTGRGRNITVGVPGRRLRSLLLTGAVSGNGGNAVLTMGGAPGARGKLAVPLRG